MIMDMPEGKDFGILSEEEVKHKEESPLYDKWPENMPCSLMGPVALWESIGGGRLLYGVLRELQKPLKEWINQANLHK